MKNSRKNIDVTLALVAGAAIGGIVSILFAPDSGKQTRKKIKDGTYKATDKLSKAALELKGKTEDAYRNGKASLEAQIDSIARDVRYNREEMLPLLEKKLEEMKAKNKKVASKVNSKVKAKA